LILILEINYVRKICLKSFTFSVFFSGLSEIQIVSDRSYGKYSLFMLMLESAQFTFNFKD
jgi:hypothetical protein